MIPKIIHYCWFGGNPIPEFNKKCIESWKKYCPDYEIIEWNEGNIDLNSNNYMKEAYASRIWGFVPDVARLQIIYEYGGVYLDTDVELLKPLDDLLNNHAFMGIENGNTNTIALGLGFGAEKNDPLIKILLDDYNGRRFIKSDGTLDRTSAPMIQTAVLKKIGFNGKNIKQTIMSAVIYPSEFFCPKSVITGFLNVTKNTYSIHHYDASWYNEEQKNYKKNRLEIFNKYGSFFGRFVWAWRRFVNKLKKHGLKYTVSLIFHRINSSK